MEKEYILIDSKKRLKELKKMNRLELMELILDLEERIEDIRLEDLEEYDY